MSSLWELQNARGLAGFVGDLGWELQEELIRKNQFVRVEFSRVYDPLRGFILDWNYKNMYSGEIMIDSREDNEKDLTIHRFWGINPIVDESGIIEPSCPEELRMAVKVYEDVTAFLERKYGKPLAESDGRSIYSAHLEQSLD